MTTRIAFVQPKNAPFQFQATLDGTVYSIQCPWSLFGQRYNITIATLQGDLVALLPMVSSPIGYDISLTAGYFTTTLVWRGVHAQFEVSD